MYAVILYSVRRSRDEEVREHNHLSVDDMKAMMRFSGGCLEAREYGHLFCVALHSAQRYWVLLKESEKKENVRYSRKLGQQRR